MLQNFIFSFAEALLGSSAPVVKLGGPRSWLIPAIGLCKGEGGPSVGQFPSFHCWWITQWVCGSKSYPQFSSVVLFVVVSFVGTHSKRGIMNWPRPTEPWQADGGRGFLRLSQCFRPTLVDCVADYQKPATKNIASTGNCSAPWEMKRWLLGLERYGRQSGATAACQGQPRS